MNPAGPVIATPTSTEPSDASKHLLPWLVAVAFFMESLDTTILNTAVPAISSALGAPLSMKSVLASYTLSLAIFIPISGWMADRFGTRRVFASAIGLFTLGSVQHNQLDQTPSVKQSAQGPCILPGLAGPAGRKHRTSHLSSHRDDENHSGPEPHVDTVEKIQACPHSCQGEKERQEKHRNYRVKTCSKCALPMLYARKAYAGEEGTKQRVHSCAQVKKDKIDSSGTGGSHNVATVLTQARMAIDHPIFDPEANRKVLLDHLFLISAGEITRGARTFLVENLDAGQRRHIIFMDRDEFLDQSARILLDLRIEEPKSETTEITDDDIPF
jgi:Major Facilitator Superfamily